MGFSEIDRDSADEVYRFIHDGCVGGTIPLQCRHENGVSSIRQQRKLHLRGGGRRSSTV
jgi:hypothetical protein